MKSVPESVKEMQDIPPQSLWTDSKQGLKNYLKTKLNFEGFS